MYSTESDWHYYSVFTIMVIIVFILLSVLVRWRSVFVNTWPHSPNSWSYNLLIVRNQNSIHLLNLNYLIIPIHSKLRLIFNINYKQLLRSHPYALSTVYVLQTYNICSEKRFKRARTSKVVNLLPVIQAKQPNIHNIQTKNIVCNFFIWLIRKKFLSLQNPLILRFLNLNNFFTALISKK